MSRKAKARHRSSRKKPAKRTAQRRQPGGAPRRQKRSTKSPYGYSTPLLSSHAVERYRRRLCPDVHAQDLQLFCNLQGFWIESRLAFRVTCAMPSRSPGKRFYVVHNAMMIASSNERRIVTVLKVNAQVAEELLLAALLRALGWPISNIPSGRT